MLIVLLTLAFTALCIVTAMLCEKGKIRSFFVEMISEVFTASGVIAVIVMLIAVLCTHATSNVGLAKETAKREALVYQYEHGLYLGDAIGEFNADIVGLRQYKQSPWTNWFVGDYVFEIEPIDLNELEVSE